MTGEINAFQRWGAVDDGWDHDTGAPGISLFSRALQVWSLMQNRDVTVAEAAIAFNVEPRRIAEAVGDHPWMCLGGPPDQLTQQTIEHDGE